MTQNKGLVRNETQEVIFTAKVTAGFQWYFSLKKFANGVLACQKIVVITQNVLYRIGAHSPCN
jgi:hypothetical protein